MITRQSQAPQFTDPERRQKLATALPQIETVFETFLQQRAVPGVTFGVVIDGALAHARGYGLANLSTQAPATPDTVFRIASMTKSFTAMCIVKLRDEGRLRLDDPVADYVPELASLVYPTRDSAPITIRQLLTMSGGFPQDDPWADRQLGEQEAVFSAWMRGGISFSNPPGVVFEYSNYGYAILGRVVANVSGMPYQQYAEASIFQPLEMTSTTFDVSNVPPERLAMGYRPQDGTWAEEPPLPDGAFAAMGGLFTTIPDFARYMAFLLSAFPPQDDDETGPIRRSSAREMQQIWRTGMVSATRAAPNARLIVQSAGYGYGLGCSIDSVLGYTVAHGGGLPGYGSFYRLLPEYGVGVVAFSNLTYAGPAQAVTEALLALQKTDGLKPRVLAPSAVLLQTRDGLARLYEQWEDQDAAALATETFYLDMPMDKRREQFAQLRADLGTCTSITAIQPENALRGRWTMHCEHGSINVFATLAPTVPPRLQYLALTSVKPLNATLRLTVFRLLRLIRQWDETGFRKLFALGIDRGAIRSQLEALRVQYGTLHVGDTLEGDGTSHAQLRLIGTQGAIEVALVVDPRSGRIKRVTFSKPRETTFTL